MEELLKPDADASSIGKKLGGRFRIEAVRSGGMATVYVVRDLIGEKLYAAKTIARSYFESPELAEAFLRETEVWLLLGGHPHVVQAYFSDIVEGRPFIFLEALSGSTLRDVLRGRLPVDVALDYARQICIGMTHAEAIVAYGDQASVIHGDLKPDNVLIVDPKVHTGHTSPGGSEARMLKISDFGLSNIMGANLSDSVRRLARRGLGYDPETRGFLGTPQYMAPERFEGGFTPSVQSDIYSFGVILYELVTGILPFAAASFADYADAHKSHPIPKVSDHVAAIPPSVDAILARCLAKTPALRFQSFTEILTALDSLVPSATATIEVPKPPAGYSARREIDLNLKGISLARIKQFESALWYFRKVQRPPAHLNEATVLLELNRPTEALRCVNQVLEVTPNYDGAWNLKGLSLKRLGELDLAMECFERAVWLDSWPLDGTLNLADTLRLKGDYDAALRLLNYYLNEVPDDCDALCCKASCVRATTSSVDTVDSGTEPVCLDINRTRFHLISPYSTILTGRGGRLILKDL